MASFAIWSMDCDKDRNFVSGDSARAPFGTATAPRNEGYKGCSISNNSTGEPPSTSVQTDGGLKSECTEAWVGTRVHGGRCEECRDKDPGGSNKTSPGINLQLTSHDQTIVPESPDVSGRHRVSMNFQRSRKPTLAHCAGAT